MNGPILRTELCFICHIGTMEEFHVKSLGLNINDIILVLEEHPEWLLPDDWNEDIADIFNIFNIWDRRCSDQQLLISFAIRQKISLTEFINWFEDSREYSKQLVTELVCGLIREGVMDADEMIEVHSENIDDIALGIHMSGAPNKHCFLHFTTHWYRVEATTMVELIKRGYRCRNASYCDGSVLEYIRSQGVSFHK